MGTVCLGLLIALGLEQAAEAWHHHHQRLELQERLLAEAHSDQDSIENDFQFIDTYLEWLSATAADVDRAGKAHQPLAFRALPTHFPGHPEIPLYPDIPNTGAWTSAQHSGLISLLSPEQQAQDTYLYFAEDETFQNWVRFDNSLSSLRVFWYRFEVPGSGAAPDLSTMTAADAAEYRTLLAKAFEEARSFRRTLVFYAGANRAKLRGASDWSALIVPSLEETRQLHPDRFPGLEDVSLNHGTAWMAPSSGSH